MRPVDISRAQELANRIQSFDRERRALPGIHQTTFLDSYVEQLVESMRRVEYVKVLLARPLGRSNADPVDDAFDPLKAAILRQREGNTDEAFWLVFLSIHFGKHFRSGWLLTREVYGGLGENLWTWERISCSPSEFSDWLRRNRVRILGKFGNHRKYESLDADSPNGTGAVIESYIRWVGDDRDHQSLVARAMEVAGHSPEQLFHQLYVLMSGVRRFGRTARFDFLTMVGKLNLAPLVPDTAYIRGSTGPKTGALLMFTGTPDGNVSAQRLDEWVVELGSYLGVGMQEMEDSLCNWQKSPERFRPFRG